MDKEESDILKKLKKEEKYDEIFKQFGQKQFAKSVSRKYKKQDIGKLKREGKFEDIYLRYGNGEYKKLLKEAKQREIEEAYGKRSMRAFLYKTSNRIKSAFGALLIGTGIVGGAGTLAIGTTIVQSEQLKSKEKAQYAEEIKEYQDKVSEYAENIKAMGLTDLEIFMKLQADMHNSIRGYATPKLDIFGYEGVDMSLEDGTGICRNMANDIMYKLNAINPEYNAREFIVKNEGGTVYTANININKIEESNEEVKLYKGNEIQMAKIICNVLPNQDAVNNLLGNHRVVAVDLKKENTTIIIDPTYALLGVFQDGKITILNSADEIDPVKMYRTPIGEIISRGSESLEVPSEYIKSFSSPYTIEELREKYGVEAQQRALASANDKEFIYNAIKRDFKSSIKVDLERQKENVYSTDNNIKAIGTVNLWGYTANNKNNEAEGR